MHEITITDEQLHKLCSAFEKPEVYKKLEKNNGDFFILPLENSDFQIWGYYYEELYAPFEDGSGEELVCCVLKEDNLISGCLVQENCLTQEQYEALKSMGIDDTLLIDLYQEKYKSPFVHMFIGDMNDYKHTCFKISIKVFIDKKSIYTYHKN